MARTACSGDGPALGVSALEEMISIGVEVLGRAEDFGQKNKVFRNWKRIGTRNSETVAYFFERYAFKAGKTRVLASCCVSGFKG